MSTDSFEQTLIADQSTSHWLKAQLSISQQRDPLDALNDAELLVMAIQNRLSRMASTNMLEQGDKP